MTPTTFPFGLYVIALAAAVEVAGGLASRRTASSAPLLLRWTVRPFGIWALIAAYHELQPWTQFKERLWAAFPVYATPWVDLAPSWPRGTAFATAAIGAALAVLALALRTPHAWRWLPAILVVCFAAELLIALAPHGWPGPLYPWERPFKMYAYSAHETPSAVEFLRGYVDHHHSELNLHGKTHPPGAPLVARWTTATVNGELAHPINPVLRLLLSIANVPVVYGLGRLLAGPRTAVLAAALVGLMPAATGLNTYALDPLFSAVFNACFLLAAWLALRGPSKPAVVALGLAAFAGSMLQYSWPVPIAAAMVFAVVSGRAAGRPWGELARTAGAAAGVFLLAHAALAVSTGFDYFAAYGLAWNFHETFYPLKSAHDALLALVASPFDMWIGLGPIAGCALVAALAGRGAGVPVGVRYLAVAVLALYAIPLVFGPGSMKFETARTWHWVLPACALLAAAWIDRRWPDDDRPLVVAAGASAFASLLLLSLFNFGA